MGLVASVSKLEMARYHIISRPMFACVHQRCLAVRSAVQSSVGPLLCLARSGNTLEMCISTRLFVSNGK